MIKLGLILLAYMVPGLLIGFLIISIFPHIPLPLLVIASVGIVAGGFYKYRQKRKEEYILNDNVYGMPDWIGSNAQNIFLAVVTLISGIVIFYVNKTDLYLDNGGDKEIVVNTSHYGTVKVPPHYHQQLSVVKGDIEFEYEGKKRKFKITEDGNWVLNIDTQNTYVRTSIVYSTATTLYKEGSTIPETKAPETEFIKDEFFDAKVDYMFQAPETIKVEDSRTAAVEIKKKILYRLSDWAEEEASQPANDDNQEDSIVAKPLKKKGYQHN